MSGPWTRFGVRALALALLLVGVGGGYYLSQMREDRRQGISAQLAAEAAQEEIGYLKERQREYTMATAQQREAQRLAAEKAAAAAEAGAGRLSKAEEEASRKKREKAETKPYAGPIPASCNVYSGNRKIGCAMMIDAGFPISEFPCLEKLWTKESGWNHKARNSSSGAYGIAQAYPGSKMASAGSDWETNPATQIKWGLGYVKGRYKTPCGAWTYFQNNGSY
ncbi:lytic transglycosylase domain-containing protein [Micromonospora sp. CPCC 205371]|nr:lytic transglycosylase domain-containing protein [Micromonospora sp. CPCC 205371]